MRPGLNIAAHAQWPAPGLHDTTTCTRASQADASDSQLFRCSLLSNAFIRGGTTLEPAEVSHYQSAVVTADWQRSAGLLEISDPSVSVGSVAVYRQLLAVPVPRQLVLRMNGRD